jgi:hypothetical protein
MNSWQTLFEGPVGNRLVTVEKNDCGTLKVKIAGHENHGEAPVVAASREKLKEELLLRGLFPEEDVNMIVENIPGI